MSKYTKMLFPILVALLFAMFLMSPACAADDYEYKGANWDIVRENKNAWMCIDYAISYARENPEWSYVVISNNQVFRGTSHLVNYKYDKEREMLLIHDEMYGEDYYYDVYYNDIIEGYEIYNHFSETEFFHFYTNENEIRRFYKALTDNRQLLFN